MRLHLTIDTVCTIMELIMKDYSYITQQVIDKAIHQSIDLMIHNGQEPICIEMGHHEFLVITQRSDSPAAPRLKFGGTEYRYCDLPIVLINEPRHLKVCNEEQERLRKIELDSLQQIHEIRSAFNSKLIPSSNLSQQEIRQYANELNKSTELAKLLNQVTTAISLMTGGVVFLEDGTFFN